MGVVREMSGEVEIVPGIVGPERIVNDSYAFPERTSKHPALAHLRPVSDLSSAVDVRIDIRFDQDLRRYICHELTAYRDLSDRPHSGRPVTTEVLRQIQVERLIQRNVLVNYPGAPTTSELENPDGVEPWGLTMPEGLTDRGPTDRVLKWVAHFYRWGYAVSYGATKSVEESLKLPRSTAGRWIKLAREAGYLGPAEGPGKAGG